MYAVIFKAETGELDEVYFEKAKRLRELAETKYGCKEFISFNEGNRELSISYWDTLEQINHWKQDAEHIKAQEMGRRKWYRRYRIQVVEILRDYTD